MPGIAEHVLAMTDKLLAAQRDDRPLLDQIERAPVRLVGAPSTNRCAQALSAMICAAPALTKSAKRKSGISIAGCSVSTASRTSLHRVGRRSRRQIGRACERQIRARPTRISLPAIEAVPPSGMTVSARMRPAIGPSTLMCFCPASLVAAIFQPNRFRWPNSSRSPPGSHSLRRGRAAAAQASSASKLGAGAPMIVQGLRRRRDLVLSSIRSSDS